MEFAEKDLVFYDRVGVCRVEKIGCLSLRGLPKDVAYYTLRPCFQSDTILLPTRSSAYLRRVLTREEAEALLTRLPALEPLEITGLDAKGITALYQQCDPIASCECLARIAKAIYQRGQARAASGRRPVATDQRFRRFSENLLYGELATVLEIPQEEVERYILQKVEAGTR